METKIDRQIEILRIAVLTLSIICLIVFVLSLTSCKKENVVSTCYKVLRTSRDLYTMTMQSAAYLYKQGKINDKQKKEIIYYGNIFYDDYLAAVNTLEDYKQGKVTKEDLISMMSNLLDHQGKFLKAYESTGNELPKDIIILATQIQKLVFDLQKAEGGKK